MFQQFDSLLSIMQVFTDEMKCVDHFRAVRWPNGVVCPHCGSCSVYDLANGTHKCGEKECALKFSVRHDTIFADSKLPLMKWFMAIYLVTSHKKGISSCQLARDIGVTQKSAWHMLHRIRAAIEVDRTEPLSGTVEIDETYVGGKEKNRHANKRLGKAHGGAKMIPVMGMVERGGDLRIESVKYARRGYVRPMIASNIATGSIVNTDESRLYRYMRDQYTHVSVNHSAGEYVRGDVYTNTIEGAFGHFKRSIIGVYHKTSPKHIDRYLNMFAWR